LAGEPPGSYDFTQEKNKLKPKTLLITTLNLATNPRLLKELRLLLENGHEVTVILFRMGNWSDKPDDELRASFKTVRFIQLSALRSPFWPWLLSSLLEKFYRWFPLAWLNTSMLSIAAGKRSFLLVKAVKQLGESFDWVIAHNPAAFFPAYMAAQRKGASLGIDVEDYHPGETNNPTLKAILMHLMQRILPKATYCSFASPLIKQYTEKGLPVINRPHHKVVNNVFSQHEFPLPPAEADLKRKLQFVWFSQFIDYGRGLEQLFPLFDELKDSIEITFIGSVREQFLQKELVQRTYITCLPSTSQWELHQQLCSYDVGMALEDRNTDANRNVCLTNKIWAYFQAGLYILATATDAQQEFLEQFPLHGELISFDPTTGHNSITDLLNRKEEILLNKVNRYQNARPVCWETESAVLLSEWNTIRKQ